MQRRDSVLADELAQARRERDAAIQRMREIKRAKRAIEDRAPWWVWPLVALLLIVAAAAVAAVAAAVVL